MSIFTADPPSKPMNILAQEIVTGLDNLDKMRDFIIRVIRNLTQAVEMTDEPSNKFRARYLEYQWNIEYKNRQVGKSWCISCSKCLPDNTLKIVFVMESACVMADEHVCGMYGTMNELVTMFTSHFTSINRRLEILRNASTINIP